MVCVSLRLRVDDAKDGDFERLAESATGEGLPDTREKVVELVRLSDRDSLSPRKSRGNWREAISPASAEAADETGSKGVVACNEALACPRKERAGDAGESRAKNDGRRLRRLRRFSERSGGGDDDCGGEGC
jgi:hypothetical protein